MFDEDWTHDIPLHIFTRWIHKIYVWHVWQSQNACKQERRGEWHWRASLCLMMDKKSLNINWQKNVLLELPHLHWPLNVTSLPPHSIQIHSATSQHKVVPVSLPLYNFSIHHHDPGWGPATTLQTWWKTALSLCVPMAWREGWRALSFKIWRISVIMTDLQLHFYPALLLGVFLNKVTHLWHTVTDN